GRRTARGASTVMFGQVARIGLQLASVVVLARLLTPSDYGLFAIVLAVAGLGEILRDFGLSSAAVQAASLTDRQRDQLFWVNSAIGAGLGLVVAGSSPLFARLLGHDELIGMLAVMSVTFVLNGMAAQYRADLNRRMRFAALVVGEVAAQVLG